MRGPQRAKEAEQFVAGTRRARCCLLALPIFLVILMITRPIYGARPSRRGTLIGAYL